MRHGWTKFAIVVLAVGLVSPASAGDGIDARADEKGDDIVVFEKGEEVPFEKTDRSAQLAVEDAYVTFVPRDEQLDLSAEGKGDVEIHCWADTRIVACWIGDWLVSCEKVGEKWDCGVAHESELKD